MLFNELKDDKTIKNWLSGIGARKHTKIAYIDSLRAYTEFLQKTPEQIIEESEEDIKNGKLMREKRIFDEMREFTESLESSRLAPTSIKSRLTAIRSFYTFYNIQLPALPRSATKARPKMENRKIPEKEDIREVLSVADVRDRAIILTGVSSGLSSNEISNLKLQEFLEGYDHETEITTLHLIREKVGYEFYTFLTPECSRAIWEYLEYRNRTSEKTDKYRQQHLLKQKVEYDKKGNGIGYLFIGGLIPSEFLTTKNEELRKLEPDSIQKMYRELCEKARNANPKGEWNLVRSHNVRKFFNSTMLANSASIFFTDFLMGHQIDGTRDAYFRADPKKLREEYQKYIPYLTIKKDIDVSESPEYQQIKHENVILQTETARHVIERSELQDLRKEVQEMKEENKDRGRLLKTIGILLDDEEIKALLDKM